MNLAAPCIKKLTVGGIINDESCKVIAKALESFKKIEDLAIIWAPITELGLIHIFE